MIKLHMVQGQGQDAKLGAERVAECMTAQYAARGLANTPEEGGRYVSTFPPSTSKIFGGPTVSAKEWERHACQHMNAGCIKCGNHQCLPKTCYKGRLGKAGFCRMRYFHWRAF